MSIKRDGQGDSCVISGAFGNTPLQVTRWSGQRASLTLTAISQVLAMPGTDPTMCEITATQDCFMKYGNDAGVVATKASEVDGSRFFLAGLHVTPTPIDPVTKLPYTHVAFIMDKIPAFVQVEQVI